jgi:chitinase
MNHKLSGSFFILILLASLISCDLFDNNSGVPMNENIWVNAYLVSWQHNPETEHINSGIMRTNEIDWDAMTHLTYFSLNIAGDGSPSLSLDPELRHNFNSDRLRSIVPAAHANNTKILFSVGGDTNYEGFSAAIDTSRTRFIETISNLITEYGFDGVSLSMTPIEPLDFSNYREFVRQLSSTFDTLRTNQNNRPLLTAGATNAPGMSSLFRSLQQHFDQINILTHDMARPWRGWIPWHQSAMFNNSLVLENTTQHLPSVNEKVNEWIASGIDRSKIGFTISFYASIWEDVHLLEKWATWPIEDLSIYRTVPYSVVRSIYDLTEFEWDEKAQAAYLQLENPRAFISFDNEKSISAKIKYAKTNRLGGVMIWDLSGGFSRNASPENLLLGTIKPHVNK